MTNCSLFRRSPWAVAPLAFCLAAIGFGSCSPRPEVTKKEMPYRAVYAEIETQASAKRGTVSGDYAWASTASTFEDAAQRWQEFLMRHDPSDGEFEDGYHQRHV